MKYQISKTAKLPTDYKFRIRSLNRKPKNIKEVNEKERYPFSKLQTSNSFFVPEKTARQLRGAIYGATQRYAHRYISRSVVKNNNVVGTRVFRVI